MKMFGIILSICLLSQVCFIRCNECFNIDNDTEISFNVDCTIQKIVIFKKSPALSYNNCITCIDKIVEIMKYNFTNSSNNNFKCIKPLDITVNYDNKTCEYEKSVEKENYNDISGGMVIINNHVSISNCYQIQCFIILNLKQFNKYKQKFHISKYEEFVDLIATFMPIFCIFCYIFLMCSSIDDHCKY